MHYMEGRLVIDVPGIETDESVSIIAGMSCMLIRERLYEYKGRTDAESI